MSKDYSEIEAWEFAALAAEDVYLWSELVGAKVNHSDRGQGQITGVEQRHNYTPLISLEFSGEKKVWPPESFKNGKTKLTIAQDLLSRVEEVGKKRAEARRLAAIKLEQEAEERRRIAAQERAEWEKYLAEQEAARKERERFANLPLTEKHKEILARLGLPYKGLRPATPRHRRVTHCYACWQHLDNSVDVECVTCGWILCTCGACGCGYSR